MAVTTRNVPTRTEETRAVKGMSLARGPALAIGTILLVAGLYFLYKQHGFPKFSNFPNGSAPVQGKVFFGIFGVNGWTGMLTAAAGGVLLFGAAQHLLAKTMSLIAGVALGAAAVIALISGNVLGMAAANGWTKLGWGVVAVILLFNTLIPRRTTTVAAEPRMFDRRTMVDEQAAEPDTARTGRRWPWSRRRTAETAAAGAGAEPERVHERENEAHDAPDPVAHD